MTTHLSPPLSPHSGSSPLIPPSLPSPLMPPSPPSLLMPQLPGLNYRDCFAPCECWTHLRIC